MIRLNVSRPRWSVPNGCSSDGGVQSFGQIDLGGIGNREPGRQQSRHQQGNHQEQPQGGSRLPQQRMPLTVAARTDGGRLDGNSFPGECGIARHRSLPRAPFEAQARIRDAQGNVSRQVRQQHDYREVGHEPLHHRVVPRQGRAHDQLTQTRPGEYRLG